MPPSSKTMREFDVEFLQSLLDGKDDDPVTPILERQFLTARRWSCDYSLVFKFEGKFWQTTYMIGCGEEYVPPWFGLTKVTCTQVVPKLVTTTKYEVYQAA